MQSDLVIMGIQDPERALDVKAMRARFARPDFQAAFERVNIDSLVAAFSHEIVPLGVLNALDLQGPIQTLRHPRLSHLAAQAFFRGKRGKLPELVRPESVRAGRKNSLLHRLVEGETLPPVVLGVAASENCRFDRGGACATFIAKWMHAHPFSERTAIVLSKLRKNPNVRPELRGDFIEGLAAFYNGEKRDRRKGSIPLVTALNKTRRYVKNFSLIVPFDRGALENIWRACDTPACEGARHTVEETVGPLDIYSTP
jgi:hypothetical protein